jgi:hypothetical protein
MPIMGISSRMAWYLKLPFEKIGFQAGKTGKALEKGRDPR